MKNLKISFNLSGRSNSKGEHSVYMFINWGYKVDGKYKPLKYSTGLKVVPGKRKNDSKDYANWFGYPAFKTGNDPDTNTRIRNFQTDAEEVVADLQEKGQLTPDNVKQGLDALHSPTANTPATTLNAYMEQYLHDAKYGIRLTDKNTVFKNGSVKVITTMKNVFLLFQKHKGRTYDFGDINQKFYTDYKGFLTSVEVVNKKGKVIKAKYQPNTIGNNLKHFKMMVKAALEEGVHSNDFILKSNWKGLNEESTKVYLTENEIMAIQNLELDDKELKRDRDVFLIGCYTAQRFGDYSKINKDQVSGNQINIYQEKTGAEAVVPMKPELRALLAKYDFTVPRTYDEKLNKNIKIICRMAGITDKVEIPTTIGGVRKDTFVEKCTQVSSHTARRSGITNMYLAGVPVIDIMKISGHADQKTLLGYIRVTAKETATKLESHPYFAEAYSPLKVAK